jgi:hypothetical protein
VIGFPLAPSQQPFVNPRLVALVAGQPASIPQIRQLQARGQDSLGFNAPLAYFVDLGPNGAGQYDGTYTAAVDWGDGSPFDPTAAAIVPLPGFFGEIIGRHHDKHPGKYKVTLTLRHGSFVLILTVTVTVGTPTERQIEGDFESLGRRSATPYELAQFQALINAGDLSGGSAPLRLAVQRYLRTSQFL